MANRKTRRAASSAVSRMKKQGLLGGGRETVDAKIVQIIAGPGGQLMGLGKDSKAYIWDAYHGGWFLNAMTVAEKDLHDAKKLIAANAQPQQ